jgi:hypothetical protein
MPHPRWQVVSTWPQHYHEGSQEHVVASVLPSEPPDAAVRALLTFARKRLAVLRGSNGK